MYLQQQQMRRRSKHNKQRVLVNVSDGKGAGVFMGSGYRQQQRRRRQSNTGQRTQLVVSRARGIDDASEGLETITEAAGARRQA